MKKVFFAKAFKSGAAPAANGDLAIFDPVAGAYIALDEAGLATDREELVVQVMRDSQILNFPINMNAFRANVTTLVVPSAQYLTCTPTGTITSTKTYTLAVGVSGHGLDMPRYTKKYSVTGVSSVATLIDAWVVQMNAGGTVTDIPEIAFTATDNVTNIVLTVTGADYYDQTLIAWSEDDLCDNLPASAIVSTPGTSGMTDVQIKALEAAADTELGDHKFNYRTSQFFDLASGFNADCNDLAAITTMKADDDPLPREQNFNRELLLFYDADAVVGDGGDLDDVIEWLVEAGTNFPAK